MIVGSLLLLLTGVVLLVTGLIQGDDTYLVGAIIAALVAAVCIYGASRRTRARQEEAQRSRSRSARINQRRPVRHDDEAEVDSRLRGRDTDRTTAMAAAEKPVDHAEPRERPVDNRPTEDVDLAADGEAVPADEPAELAMSSVEAAALMRMDAEVMVVDGRPRFHLGGCVHLVDRESEALPAFEAVELGFSPCALCRPAQSLLREPTRR